MTTVSNTLARRAALALPIALALGAAWWFTRGTAPAPAPAGHDHSQMTTAGNGPVAMSASDAKRIGVTYATATHGQLHRDVRLAGEVVLDDTRVAAVSLKVDGTIEALAANAIGSVLTRGQPMLSLYSPMLVAAQEEMLVAMRLQDNLARRATDASAQAADLVTSVKQRLLNWDVDPADVAMVEEHKMVHRTLGIRAPVSGTVIEKNVVAGQQVMAGQTLLRVADMSQLWVEGDVFEQDLPLVRVGQEVRVEFRALPDVVRAGRVLSFEPTLSPATRTARVRVALPNPGGLLRPGMFAELHVVAPQTVSTLVVPRGAVLSTGERSLVFVRRQDGRLEPREVAVGLSDEEQVQILRGLSHGDVVVASATFLVDAESNLGMAMGGMGDMPGMDMTAPKPLDSKAKRPPAPPMPDMPGMDHSQMPGMQHDMPTAKPPASSSTRKPPLEQ